MPLTDLSRPAGSLLAKRIAPGLALLLGLAAPLASPVMAQPWANEAQRSAGRTALAAANGGRHDAAAAAATQADPLVRKIALWLRLSTRGQGTGPELAAWIAENPDWPLPRTLAIRAEEALAADPDDARALAHFARTPAATLDGAQRHADALLRAGEQARATAILRGAWAEGFGDAAAEAGFAERNATILTAEDRWRRFDRLFLSRDLNDATRAAAWLDPSRRPLADARLALAAEQGQPVVKADDLGILAASARMLRRQDRDAEAAAAWAAAAPLQRDLAPDAARAIWAERNVLARKLLRLGQDQLAYQTAAQHGQTEGEPRLDAEFMAGWIALRRLNQPGLAARHFALLGGNSASVITRARAAYWEGRALTGSDAARARTKYGEAALLGTAFYGQLAALALGEDEARLSARIRAIAPPQPTEETSRLFLGRELALAATALADLGDYRRARLFLLRMEELSPDPADRVLIARLGMTLGRPDFAVWIARRAGADGVMLLPEGWPTPYPAPSQGGLEPAITNAITRQESNFDPEAVSGANARGLMQLLPTTAAGVARRIGVPHQPGWLTTDPSHNMRLGSQYLADQLDRFSGNLALAAAAYNAGPRRVDEWLATNGTPGEGGIDVIDWIELIPFSETRNYVQRVVENVVVYRARDAATATLPHPLKPWMTAR
ncbi:lytic transglycosylase domain-containing protein [Roseomonas xinghualingensis]|uniref:lytic transglycosylase domain-containing protein n=1 Tax=Roseomonas xinghualingensis TaxID=2986475 RepID=UPI0021F2115E|nr:lytic transglycosylase domain-containing protein [Roseomonas sp. SXEYE001]MCV4206825.1 lytic transglycosylase domain-containing protein [Roseomonas sp. SXEYE001]